MLELFVMQEDREKPLRVSQIMTKEVITVLPDTSLIDAAKLLEEHRFDGLPAIDQEGKLVGLLTEYDFLSKGSYIHLPTLQKIFQNFNVMGNEEISKEKKKIAALRVRDVMNIDPLFLKESATVEEATILFRDHHRVNPIPVISDDRVLVGVLSRYDIIKLFNLIK